MCYTNLEFYVTSASRYAIRCIMDVCKFSIPVVTISVDSINLGQPCIELHSH